jgi:hypothetical protein
VKPSEYLDFVLDVYRAEHPGATDPDIFRSMCEELGPGSAVVALMADRLGEDIAEGAKQKFIDRGSDEFLRSFEWRRVRMQVLERDGARCCCCGRTAADGVAINVDHVKNRKTFPHLALDLGNLQVLCGDCNHGKGNKFSTDWRRNSTPNQVPT